MRTLYIGIDPGISGGIAAIDALGIPLYVRKMPATERDVLEALKETATLPGHVGCHRRAVIERVQASPQMGSVSAFTFGRGFGALLMALTASGIPFELVRPQDWQKALGCLSGKDKNVTKRRAQQLFSGPFTVTHATADALLLAETCRRLEGRRQHAQQEENERSKKGTAPKDGRQAAAKAQRAAKPAPSRHGAGSKREAGQRL